MTQETAKERIYREALDEINNLAIDVAMDFEETGIDSVDCGKIMDIAYKAFFAETNQQPFTTDKLSVEKLQEQLNTAKKALTEITNIPESDNYFDCEECIVMMEESAKQALAAIGGDDDENRL